MEYYLEEPRSEFAADLIPEEVAELVVIEHPEEMFNPARYWITDQARKVAKQVHSMRASAPKLRALGIAARNTTLLFGPPGTGKTEMARYIAYKERLPLMYVNMSSAVDSLMGKTSRNISEVFKFAHQGACVFMIDELDCIASNRSLEARQADGELNRTTVTLMQEIDRLPAGVVMLAATNRHDMLDAALMRRFAQVEEVQRLPEDDARCMIDAWLADVEEQLDNAKLFTPDEVDGFMTGYSDDAKVTQATVVQRATVALADKLVELAAADIEPAQVPVRAFRVFDPVHNLDVTEDAASMRDYIMNEEWAKPLRYSSHPECFLIDDKGRVRLATRNEFVVAPEGRFEVTLSRFAD
ncbi:MAG: AAA family ATPase [Eggerthellaceae bacterium]|nr:AAA family ATPase [Eggerthellaceae bacterium]